MSVDTYRILGKTIALIVGSKDYQDYLKRKKKQRERGNKFMSLDERIEIRQQRKEWINLTLKVRRRLERFVKKVENFT